MARDTRRLAIAVCVFFTLLACSNSAENLPSVSNDPIIVNPTPEPVTIMPTPKLPPTASPTKSEIAHAEIATMRVISTRPHDETAFTQGLEFYGDRLFESRGLRGSSGLSEINASDGEVLRDISLAPEFFGEGMTIVGDTIIQLTWTSGKAFVYDIETLSLVNRFEYDGEGWGLCFDGTSLYMSDGSDVLTCLLYTSPSPRDS